MFGSIYIIYRTICDANMRQKYIITEFIKSKELKDIKEQLNHVSWKSGLDSLCSDPNNIPSNYKSNLETNLLDYESWNTAIHNNLSFHNFTVTKGWSNIFISRMKEGDYYKPHVDEHIMDNVISHYSTTIFLSNPDEYDGGELSLYLNGEIKNFKLNAGHAITYETGIPHCVNEVTRGCRDVLAFWCESHIPDMNDLDALRYYSKMQKIVESKNNYEVFDCLEDYVGSDFYQFQSKTNMILKKYGLRTNVVKSMKTA